MATSLDKLIVENQESLVDLIVKDAIRQIPSYGRASLQLTMERVERWLKTLAASIEQNDPHILEHYLTAIAVERQEEGYPIGELHAIVRVTEQYLRDLVVSSSSAEIEQNALNALLEAVMGAARMVLSVTYVLSAAGKGS